MSVTPAKPVLVSDAAVQRPSREQALEAVRTLIAWAGDNPDRPGLIDTPKRVVDAYGEWFDGYEADAAKELSRTFDESKPAQHGARELILFLYFPTLLEIGGDQLSYLIR